MRMIKRTDLLQDPHHNSVFVTYRGEHQFIHVLDFPRPHEELDSLSLPFSASKGTTTV